MKRRLPNPAVTPAGNALAVLEPIRRLSRDLKKSARLMGRKQARYLTDLYYEVQEFRKAAGNMERSVSPGEPHEVVDWVFENSEIIENGIKRALGEFASAWMPGLWMQSLVGIGPVISAGMLAHLDVRLAETAGHFWRFAGLDPSVRWEKRTKRPWNAALKRLCWIAGDCFVKFQGHKDDFYGAFYVARKELEAKNNERKLYAEQARASLREKNFGKETEARKWYEKDQLPPARIHMRALRWTSKLFLSHLHHVMYFSYYGTVPPKPYVFDAPGDHRHFIEPPNWPFDEGRSLKELLVN